MGTFKFSIIGVEKSKENGLWGGLGDSSYTQLSCCCTESIGTGSHTSRARGEAGWGTVLDAGSTRWSGTTRFDLLEHRARWPVRRATRAPTGARTSLLRSILLSNGDDEQGVEHAPTDSIGGNGLRIHR